VVEENGVLAFVEYVLLPAAALAKQPGFSVERDGQDTLVYTDISKMHDDYRNDIVRAVSKLSNTYMLILLVNTSTLETCRYQGSYSACCSNSRRV
jgi:hypothetical protein